MTSLLIGLLVALQAQSAEPERNAHRTVWDGVYTVAQANKGEAIYAKSCLDCHRSDLSGYSGVLLNPHLLDNWREDNIDSLFNVIKTTMPRGAPASLTDEAYVEIVAYILRANDFPAGAAELRLELLPQIRMQAKSGPQDLPTGSLVRVVGCLAQDPHKVWVLERSGEPVRTRNPNRSSEDEFKRWPKAPLGTLKFNLMAFEIYGGASKAGYKVEAKGFLIRKPADQTINLTALQTIASTCEP